MTAVLVLKKTTVANVEDGWLALKSLLFSVVTVGLAPKTKTAVNAEGGWEVQKFQLTFAIKSNPKNLQN